MANHSPLPGEDSVAPGKYVSNAAFAFALQSLSEPVALTYRIPAERSTEAIAAVFDSEPRKIATANRQSPRLAFKTIALLSQRLRSVSCTGQRRYPRLEAPGQRT